MVVFPIDLSACSTPEYPVVTYKFVGSISIKRIKCYGYVYWLSYQFRVAVYQCKGSVCGGGGGAWGGSAWCEDLTFFPKFVVKFPFHRQIIPVKCTKYPSADKFYQGCYGEGKVREKRKIFKVREKSGNFLKSQGTLFSGAMHQGWQWAFKGKIEPLWTFSTWWSFLFWK